MDKLTVARFPQPSFVGERDWGEEIMLVHAPQKYTLKRIKMNKGSKGGLQYHRLKDEAGVMLRGKMLVRYDGGDGTLVTRVVSAGDSFHFPPASVHQAEALTDCEYIEASTPHFNDRVHVEGKYGIDHEDGGLPTTEISEVQFR